MVVLVVVLVVLGVVFLAPVAAVALPLLLAVLKPPPGPPKPLPGPPKPPPGPLHPTKMMTLPQDYSGFLIEISVSRHFQPAICRIFHVESESEVKNA